MSTRKQTPSMTVGPWFSYGLTPEDYGRKGLATGTVAKSGIPGQRLHLSGRVLDGAGQPMPDAMLEIWQANAQGRYAHAADTRAAVPLDAGFSGFGRVSTNAEGGYAFATIKPGRVPAGGNIMQAPHLNLTVFARGVLSHLYTRIYFSDEAAANGEDPILALVEPARRGTLVAQRATTGDAYTLDIQMQGANETVFFEA
jgi:protocatechuate 3,4-dioxygenase, alpha subunit